MKKIYYYTVYLAKTDEIVASGTSKECAKELGKSLNNFHSTVSKNKLGKHKKYSILKEILFIDSYGNILERDDDME